ncbi:serine protease inhibitor Cvsi-2-like [Saccostrea echinata]|uniref:serine protease inhibitor Cvsi-2-like n=1 Tax=Saccostrea echinata TaxID=191078 RepID=UPI002A820D91|nr:serine protease inhibitor Cvsi-2-like [Saccostrea echinata]
MKVIVILAVVVVAAYAETCTSPGDCTATSCGTGTELHCVDGACTCTHAATGDGACTNANDCHGRCNHGRHHCIDGRCRCSHF